MKYHHHQSSTDEISSVLLWVLLPIYLKIHLLLVYCVFWITGITFGKDEQDVAHMLPLKRFPVRDVNQNFMLVSEGWASYPSQWVFTGSAEKTYCISGCFQAWFYWFCFWPRSSAWSTLWYKVPRLTQKDIFHFLERTGCGFFIYLFFSDFAGGVWFYLCIVVLSQYCALAQFFIQTNILNNDLQDADHSPLISILFLATQHQKISNHRQLLFISHNMTNQTLITISAKIRSTNHLFCSYYIFLYNPRKKFIVYTRSGN